MKYEITNAEHPLFPELRRIRYLKNIPRHGVKVGDIGGYIESMSSLSQDGDCVILDNAHVAYGSVIADDAAVKGNAGVFGSYVHGSAIILGRSAISSCIISEGVVDFPLRNVKIKSLLRWAYECVKDANEV